MTETLYRIETETSEARAGVLINAMAGGMDAGHAARLVAGHLTTHLDVTRVATFDVDELLDYRSRRPVMTFSDWQFTDYAEPEIVIDRLHDDEGTPVLLLHGPEPDLRWNAFSKSVIDLVERFGVTRTINVHGVPMGVPHTRPTTVTAHATDNELIGPQPQVMGTIQLPASMTALIELRLGQAGHDAVGFSANVPHYLAQSEYPQAATALVQHISRNTGLSLPLGDLEAAASETTAEIERQVSASSEVSAVVETLEQQFDAFMDDAQDATRATLLAEPNDLPTAEEIGAEFEAFLAEQATPGVTGQDGDQHPEPDDRPEEGNDS